LAGEVEPAATSAKDRCVMPVGDDDEDAAGTPARLEDVPLVVTPAWVGDDASVTGRGESPDRDRCWLRLAVSRELIRRVIIGR
jgi:hypothetical protein